MEPGEPGEPAAAPLVNGAQTRPGAGEESRPALRAAQSCEENEDAGGSSSDGESNNLETRPCPKYRWCRDAPSTSRESAQARDEPPRRNRKRAASRPSGASDNGSSDPSDGEYSLDSEDGCIYTYRGGAHLADLPSSFFSLDMGLPLDRHLPAPAPAYAPHPEPAQDEGRASSPEMDFLEMDFDPGPSCEADSGEETGVEEDDRLSPLRPPEPEPPLIRGTTPEGNLASPQHRESIIHYDQVAGPSGLSSVGTEPLIRPSAATPECEPSTSYAPRTSRSPDLEGDVQVCSSDMIFHMNARGERLVVRRTCSQWPRRAPVTHHNASGDLVCEVADGAGMWSMANCAKICVCPPDQPGQAVDMNNLSSALYHKMMAKKLVVEKPDEDFMLEPDTSNLEDSCRGEGDSALLDEGVCEVGRCMIWSEREACERQVTQIGTSACGATAVINVLLALGIPINTKLINEAVGTRQRANNAPIPRYLVSRSLAGCTAEGLVAGLQQGSGGLVTARFFPTYPERVLSLSHWLADWISLGAVPVATLNLQAGCEIATETPDAWHHQMIFGVSPRGVFLTNPVECVKESQLWPQLCSDSVLLVRSWDVVSRYTSHTDLAPLAVVPDRRWATHNVLGQVVNVIREYTSDTRGLRHVRVPCSYRAGITVATLTGSEAHKRLTRAPPLPLYAAAPA